MRNDEKLLPEQRLCSNEYTVNFMMMLIVLLTSAGMLVYKVMHLVHLPQAWVEHQRLAAEAAELEECQEEIDRRMEALGSEECASVELDPRCADAAPAEYVLQQMRSIEPADPEPEMTRTSSDDAVIDDDDDIALS